MSFCAGIVLFLLLFFSPSWVYAAVVLNEIFPKTEDPIHQWIELYNTGSETVLLKSWGLSHTAGDGKRSFDFNESDEIQGYGFLLLSQVETGITLSPDGDTVRLINHNGTIVDNVSFPGSLGENVALGRDPNGTGVWGICPSGTPGTPNSGCTPTPTPTRAPTPTFTPTPTSPPTPTGTPGPTSTPGPSANPTPLPIDQKPQDTPAAVAAILGTSVDPQTAMAPSAPFDFGADIPVATPTPVAFMQSEAYRYVWVAGMGIGVLLAVVVVIVGRNHKKRKIVLHI